LGDRKGTQPVNTSASKLLGMVVNVSVQGIAQSTTWVMKSFGLSCEDAPDMDDWRLRIKGQLANSDLP